MAQAGPYAMSERELAAGNEVEGRSEEEAYVDALAAQPFPKDRKTGSTPETPITARKKIHRTVMVAT